MNNRHGMSGSPEHNSWQSMKTRCLNPNDKSFHIYGGKGIAIFPEWSKSFGAFFSYMGARPEGTTLGRIDGSKDYVPGNVDEGLPAKHCFVRFVARATAKVINDV